MNCNINWKKFMSRHNLKWQYLPKKWEEGGFIGNGLLGAMIYSESEDKHKKKSNVLRWEIGRTDVTAQKEDVGYLIPRVLIGDFFLEPTGMITWEDCNLELDLWNAQINGNIPTNIGNIQFNSFVHSTKNVIIVDIITDDGEKNAKFNFYPQHGISPFLYYKDNVKAKLPPQPFMYKEKSLNISEQIFLTGGKCVVVWKSVLVSKNYQRYYISIGNDFGDRTAKKEAMKSVNEAIKTDFCKLLNVHRKWWNTYYKQSFISLPDTRLESFYWIQIYKLASATRSEHHVIDNQGPWMTMTPWPGVWWNLNVQLSYSPIYAANRLALGESLCKSLDKNFDNLINNVPEKYRYNSAGIGRASTYDMKCATHIGWEMGNLIWLCHNYWRQYRYSMDDNMLENRLFPLLKRSVNLYLNVLEEWDDGKLHIPKTHSPEYGGNQNLLTRDCNYDLALLKWGLSTLLKISNRLSNKDENLNKWEEVLEKLVEYPVNENGFMIGRDISFEYPHRHPSHMLSIYPLHILDLDNKENLALAKKSMNHWLGKEGALSGFSFTLAAGMSAAMKDGDMSLKLLNIFLDAFLKPNTMYLEKGPVIETPLNGAEAIQEMILQSWNGFIDVFPAIPDYWKDISFHNLRAEGAFLVSAVRQNGNTSFIRIKSLNGETCRIKTDIINPVIINSSGERRRVENKIIELNLKKNEEIIVTTSEYDEDFVLRPVREQKHMCNYYGSAKIWRRYLKGEKI